jgi:hypothetical protein
MEYLRRRPLIFLKVLEQGARLGCYFRDLFQGWKMLTALFSAAAG